MQVNEIQQPEMSSLARRKLSALQANGYGIVGLAIGRVGKCVGTLTTQGRVDWYAAPDGVEVADLDLSVIPVELLRAELDRRAS